MTKKFKCPACGAINEQRYEDCVDSEDYGNIALKKYYGFCANCGTNLVWVEKFEFLGYEEIKIFNK